MLRRCLVDRPNTTGANLTADAKALYQGAFQHDRGLALPGPWELRSPFTQYMPPVAYRKVRYCRSGLPAVRGSGLRWGIWSP